jgi:hypothetical protein
VSTTKKQEYVAEAICSALYNMDLVTFLGERDDDITGNLVTWFRIGEKPKAVRVAVFREAEGIVAVRGEWLNYTGDPLNPLLGSLTIRISTHAEQEADLQPPTTQAVVRMLEIYRDVLEEDGVAGPLEALAPEPDEPEDEEPEDMAADYEAWEQ